MTSARRRTKYSTRLLLHASAAALPLVFGQAARAQTEPAAPAPAQAQAQAAVTLHVERFDVQGNTLLPAERIAAVLDPYKGERTLAELERAAAALQAAYRDAGYGAVLASVPPQTPGASGTVTIAVLEGKVAQVRVEGNQHFGADAIRASVPALQPGATPQMRQIDTELQMANENPAKNVDVLLQPGQRAGDVDAELRVTEQPLQRFTLHADNSGTETTGRLRAGAGWQHADLTGHDDVLSIDLDTAPQNPGNVIVASAGYRYPLYVQHMMLEAYGVYSDIDSGTTATAAGDLQFTGRGSIVGVRASRYLQRVGEIDQRISLALENRDYRNDCQIAGLPEGACGAAGASVSVQPVALGYAMQKNGPTSFGFTGFLVHNLMLGGSHSSADDFEAIRPGARPHYTALRINGYASMPLPKDWLAQARIAGQYTDDGLVPGEQFGIGGAASVRGYDERELAGDIGASATLEILTPDLLAPAKRGDPSLRLLAFGDGGWVKNRLGTACLGTQTECAIGSLGVGLRGSVGGLEAHLDVGHAMKSASFTKRNDTRVHVALSYSF
ncbi:MAG: ShlB/FhaC/HecB family hemolysin secretion/activation protein [Proteobacteria bacterium]|nr:ShlB/FhaC/HecB family hemolysin secretion/activation protein [Pseudomonadota bacterium]